MTGVETRHTLANKKGVKDEFANSDSEDEDEENEESLDMHDARKTKAIRATTAAFFSDQGSSMLDTDESSGTLQNSSALAGPSEVPGMKMRPDGSGFYTIGEEEEEEVHEPTPEALLAMQEAARLEKVRAHFGELGEVESLFEKGLEANEINEKWMMELLGSDQDIAVNFSYAVLMEEAIAETLESIVHS